MSDTPEGNICKVSANLGWASDTLAEVAKALLKLSAEIKTILRERDNFQDQRDFAMGEIERLRRERDEAVKSEISAIKSWDEERKRVIREGERVLEAREKYLAMRALSKNATELAEKYKQERDEAREALRKIAAADWKTSGELRGMARRVLEAAK